MGIGLDPEDMEEMLIEITTERDIKNEPGASGAVKRGVTGACPACGGASVYVQYKPTRTKGWFNKEFIEEHLSCWHNCGYRWSVTPLFLREEGLKQITLARAVRKPFGASANGVPDDVLATTLGTETDENDLPVWEYWLYRK